MARAMVLCVLSFSRQNVGFLSIESMHEEHERVRHLAE
jgi:hypothetical protein